MSARRHILMRLAAVRDERGFSVLEGLVSLTLLLLAISGAASLFGAAAVHEATSVQATAAVSLLRAEMDALRDLRYEDIPVGVATTTPTAANTAFTVTRTITTDDPQPNMKRIRVVASWNQQGLKQYVVETIFTNLK